MEVFNMALSNLFGWNKKAEAAPAAACGSACGAGDKPAEKPAVVALPAVLVTSLRKLLRLAVRLISPLKIQQLVVSACGAGDK
jgi:hypothetical protein